MATNTAEIEKHLLKIITNDKIRAQAHIMGLDEAWFTGNRSLIHTIIKEVFQKTPTIITTELFEAELSRLFPDKELQKAERDRYMTEWTLIQNCHASESVDALIEELRKRETTTSISTICSDAMGLLRDGNIEEAQRTLVGESIKLGSSFDGEKEMVVLTDIADLDKTIDDKKRDPARFAGIETGFKRFDKMLGGLYKGELTIVAAVTGVGKSTFLKQLAYNIITGNHFNPEWKGMKHPGKNVLHITNEESLDQVRLKYSALAADLDYFSFKTGQIEEDDRQKWRDVAAELQRAHFGTLYIKELKQFSSCANIYRAYSELEQQGARIDVIILDYMDHLTPLEKAWSEYDEQARVSQDCKQLSVSLDIPVVAATQAATIVEQRQERGQHFGKLNVYGSKRRVHNANNFIGIMERGFIDTQMDSGERANLKECDKILRADIVKSRDGALFSFRMRHYVRTGRLMEDEETQSVDLDGNKVLGENDGESGAPKPASLDDAIKVVTESIKPPKIETLDTPEGNVEGEAPSAPKSGEISTDSPVVEDNTPKKENAMERFKRVSKKGLNPDAS